MPEDTLTEFEERLRAKAAAEADDSPKAAEPTNGDGEKKPVINLGDSRAMLERAIALAERTKSVGMAHEIGQANERDVLAVLMQGQYEILIAFASQFARMAQAESQAVLRRSMSNLRVPPLNRG